jgi:hypothetical protein
VVEFANAEDRDYYSEKDPAHLALAKDAQALFEKFLVFDYTPGAFK